MFSPSTEKKVEDLTNEILSDLMANFSKELGAGNNNFYIYNYYFLIITIE